MLAIFFGLPAFVALLMDPSMQARPAFDAIGIVLVYDAAQNAIQFLFPTLIVIALIAALVLLRDDTFENCRLWNWKGTLKDLKRVLAIFAVGALAMIAAAWALNNYTDLLDFENRNGVIRSAYLRLPREAPIILVLIAVGYPWASCYPQEITHRAYFFHRYQCLMPMRWLMAVNAVAFMWMHVPFWSLEALALTLPGGVLFAYTYQRTKSTLAATIEHALYGWWAFFTGLGWFVFTGSIGT
jgi:membrane protease YdiL (CAAX protease family)